jgi:hypothetical protein
MRAGRHGDAVQISDVHFQISDLQRDRQPQKAPLSGASRYGTPGFRITETLDRFLSQPGSTHLCKYDLTDIARQLNKRCGGRQRICLKQVVLNRLSDVRV